MEKKQILQQTLKQLNDFVVKNHSQVTESVGSSFAINQSKYSPDGVLESEHLEQPLLVIIQTWAPQKDLNTLISQIKSLPGKAILFADFVNPVMAEKLRRRSIAFVDCAGNLSIKNKSFNEYVKGKKLSKLRSQRVRGRAFNPAGLKLIFALFNQPRFLNSSYRDISNKVNIALGSVGPVMDDLHSSGYILDDGERRLVNKKRLFERWVDGYLEKLRPKQILTCYTSEDKNWWQKADPEKFHGLWGGEIIIARPTPFMTPESITLYFSSETKHKDFAEFYGLKQDDEGEICIYKSFWSPAYAGENNIDGINPMIIYADIVDSINPGSWDVAKTFYGEAIAGILEG
ncbi:hypothetical protein MNBD_GAMMA05-1290 [hydrothermal vent metagenome]|uniref:Uncharacterized protein n=1 Tax=hydrothermal vent metagenome TaxID=652676 RepID=A0A3B0WU93_9ZZZZ